jgi:hypothetical protein
MSGRMKVQAFDAKLQTPERHGRFPRIALRQRSKDHPMIMFAMLVSSAFASMVLMMPASGAVFTKPDDAPVRLADQSRDTDKTERLRPMSDTDRICHGQAWGAENETCLLVIAKENGKAEQRKIRMIANAAPLRTTPNVF